MWAQASANCRILDIVNFMTDLGILSRDDPRHPAPVTKLVTVKFKVLAYFYPMLPSDTDKFSNTFLKGQWRLHIKQNQQIQKRPSSSHGVKDERWKVVMAEC